MLIYSFKKFLLGNLLGKLAVNEVVSWRSCCWGSWQLMKLSVGEVSVGEVVIGKLGWGSGGTT